MGPVLVGHEFEVGLAQRRHLLWEGTTAIERQQDPLFWAEASAQA